MRQAPWWTAAALALCVGVPAAADLGAPLLGGRAGPFEVQVLAAPAPLRVGPSEWNVLVSGADGGPVLLDAEVELVLYAPAPEGGAARAHDAHAGGHGRGDGAALVLHPDPAQAENGLFHAAFARLPSPGPWNATLRVRRGDASGTVTFDVAVAPAATPLADHWRAFALVPVGLGMFALHQVLRSRRAARGGRR